MTIDLPDGYEELPYDEFEEEVKETVVDEPSVEEVTVRSTGSILVTEQPKPVSQTVAVSSTTTPLQKWQINGFTIIKYGQ